MQHFDDSVTLAPECQALMARLIASCDEFQHLQEAQPRIAVLFSARALFVHGGQAAAFIGAPRWQGPTANLVAFLVAQFVRSVLDMEDPDYLIVVDAAIWSSLDVERQERLMFHELSHLVPQEDEFGVPRRSRKTGKPLLKLVPHDVEVFLAEITRYGPEIVGIEAACEAIVEGQAKARRRRFKALPKPA